MGSVEQPPSLILPASLDRNINSRTWPHINTLCIVSYFKANIQSIMASEKQVNILMQLLDEALGEVDTIEGKLSSYEEMLQSVKDQMDQISQSNRLIQISNTNNGKLLDEIQFLVVRNTFELLFKNVNYC